jgi:hypothetical protein
VGEKTKEMRTVSTKLNRKQLKEIAVWFAMNPTEEEIDLTFESVEPEVGVAERGHQEGDLPCPNMSCDCPRGTCEYRQSSEQDRRIHPRHCHCPECLEKEREQQEAIKFFRDMGL